LLFVRVAVVALIAIAACNDLRDFRGDWAGPRVGADPSLKIGVADDATARLSIDALDPHGIHATLFVDGLTANADVTSLAGAEADALAGTTFAGSPLRVYFAFVDVPDGHGQAMAIIALFPEQRVELRVLRGGTSPIYAIFAMSQA
jgi:hypothetical protein